MPVRITCPHCRRDLRLPDELYDGPAQCPLCKGGFALVWPERRTVRPAALAPAPARDVLVLCPCVSCGELIKEQAPRCPHCGVYQSG